MQDNEFLSILETYDNVLSLTKTFPFLKLLSPEHLLLTLRVYNNQHMGCLEMLDKYPYTKSKTSYVSMLDDNPGADDRHIMYKDLETLNDTSYFLLTLGPLFGGRRDWDMSNEEISNQELLQLLPIVEYHYNELTGRNELSLNSDIQADNSQTFNEQKLINVIEDLSNSPNFATAIFALSERDDIDEIADKFRECNVASAAVDSFKNALCSKNDCTNNVTINPVE